MRPKFAAVSILFFFLLDVSGFAAPLSAPLVPAPDAARIGVAAAVRGSVKLERGNEAGIIVKTGQPIYLGDEISTDDKSNLQVLLLDETIFTIGPNSAIVVDKFVYDPETQSGQINAKVVKGAFRFVTGKIARKKPSDMNVELPSGSIGVRGTIVAGRSEGSRSTVVLLGPGSRNNTNSRIGQITLSNPVNGQNKQVTVTRPGFGSTIEGPNSGPTPAFEIPPADLDSLIGSLGPSSGGDSEDEGGGEGSSGSGTQGGDPTSQAGQDTAVAGDSVESEDSLSDLFGDLSGEAADAAQNSFLEDILDVEDGLATFNDLDTEGTGGIFHYSSKNTTLNSNGSPQGSYDFDLDIDFGSRSIGGDNSSGQNQFRVTLPGPQNATYPLEEMFFGNGEDFASFEYDNVSNTDTGGCGSCNNADITIDLVNAGGIPGNFAEHSIEFDNSGTPYEGSGVAGPRE